MWSEADNIPSNFLKAACNFISKRLWHRCFPLNFSTFLRTPFSQNRKTANMQQIYRRIPMPKCDLNKVAFNIVAKQPY